MILIKHPLEFEKPLVEVVAELEALKDELSSGIDSDTKKLEKLEAKVTKMLKSTYGKLTPLQQVQLSRHADRPLTLDYIKHITTDFVELHGDRLFGDDPALVGGTAKLGNRKVMIMGHQRGRGMNDRIYRNFGMPQPEGYRKALRFFRLAEKFEMPIIAFIDTQGAYPGLEAEERGQSEAIARNLQELSEVTVPVISVVIGEGGSGGALALGVADRILMLQNACYSVISPEGCASILWRSKGDKPGQMAAKAAEALQITADKLLGFGIIEEVISEPAGGAHWNHKEAADLLSEALGRHLDELSKKNVGPLVNERYEKYRKIGDLSTAA